MRYRYLDDFRRGISVFAIFSFGIAVLGTPQCPPPKASSYPGGIKGLGTKKPPAKPAVADIIGQIR